MASLANVFQGGFDANAVEPDQGRDFSLIEAGTVLDFEVTAADVKDTSKKDGCYLALEATVIGPKFAGRKIWKNITLRNPNAKAESIGQAQLSALCHAVKIPNLKDTDQLFSKIFRGRVGIEKGKAKNANDPNGERYPDKNDIVAFEAVGGAAPQASTQRPAANAPATTAPAAPAKKAPWAK